MNSTDIAYEVNGSLSSEVQILWWFELLSTLGLVGITLFGVKIMIQLKKHRDGSVFQVQLEHLSILSIALKVAGSAIMSFYGFTSSSVLGLTQSEANKD